MTDAASGPGCECTWCPVCRIIASLRADNPEAMAKIAAAAVAFADALRDLISSPVPDGEPASDPAPAARRVQRIVLDDDGPG